MKTILVIFTIAMFAEGALALDNTYVMRVINQDGQSYSVGKKNKSICERDLASVSDSYAHFKSGICQPVAQVQSEMREKVRRYSCSLPDGECWFDEDV